MMTRRYNFGIVSAGFSVRSCLSLGLLLCLVLWLVLITSFNCLTENGSVMSLTAVVSGLCFGSIAALILIPTSIKFVLMYLVYVAICTSSAFVVLAVWRFWSKQQSFSRTDNVFYLMLVKV